MDIDILLALQEFRGMTEGFLAPILDFITKLAVGAWPIVLVCMYYWVCSRKTGRRMFCGISLAYFLNGFLKMTICAYRPWIRDARIEPYGDSIVAATGYSCPSGHSMCATSYYGSLGYALRKYKKAYVIIAAVMIFLTMFSRNYLGVHTPQDVLLGFTQGVLMIAAGYLIENWSDKDPDRRDIYVMICGIVLCIGLALYCNFKSYPLDYYADGSLIVDPMKMLPDTYEGIGLVFSYSICRYFERRGFDFEAELGVKDRFIIGTVASLPIIWWHNHIVSIITNIAGKACGKFIWGAVLVVYVTIVVPNIMKYIKKKCNL